MSVGSASWSFTEDDFGAITTSLQKFLFESNARCALLVDRSGQLVELIGETDFNSLFHQGEKESMYLADVARRVILVVLFDTRTTLGLVRLKMKETVAELTKLFEQVFARGNDGSVQPEGLLHGAEDEIDKLFG